MTRYHLLTGLRDLSVATVGGVASWDLADYNKLASLGVALATFVYIVVKTVVTILDRRNNKKERTPTV